MSVDEELIRGVPNANIQESAFFMYCVIVRVWVYGISGMWLMCAYHARSEFAHPRLMESDDVVCFSLCSCAGLVSLHV